MHKSRRRPSPPNTPGVDAELRSALIRGDWRRVAQLVAQGATLDYLSNTNTTPLHLAIRHRHTELALWLIRQGVDIRHSIDLRTTPLIAAVSAGDEAVVESLLAHGAPVNSRNRQGYTALHVAVVHRQDELIPLLVQHGAFLNPRNQQGDTPLLTAAKSVPSLINPLLAHGADPNRLDLLGYSALLLVALRGKVDNAESLITHGANVHSTTRYGETVLHLLLKRNHVPTPLFFVLAQCGVNHEARNSIGLTPLMAGLAMHVMPNVTYLFSLLYSIEALRAIKQDPSQGAGDFTTIRNMQGVICNNLHELINWRVNKHQRALSYFAELQRDLPALKYYLRSANVGLYATCREPATQVGLNEDLVLKIAEHQLAQDTLAAARFIRSIERPLTRRAQNAPVPESPERETASEDSLDTAPNSPPRRRF